MKGQGENSFHLIFFFPFRKCRQNGAVFFLCRFRGIFIFVSPDHFFLCDMGLLTLTRKNCQKTCGRDASNYSDACASSMTSFLR